MRPSGSCAPLLTRSERAFPPGRTEAALVDREATSALAASQWSDAVSTRPRREDHNMSTKLRKVGLAAVTAFAVAGMTVALPGAADARWGGWHGGHWRGGGWGWGGWGVGLGLAT